MSVNTVAKCNKCKAEFMVTGGDGFYFTTYKCEECGNPKRVQHPNQRSYQVSLTMEQIGQCDKCNGFLSKTAKDRCPECKSDDITEDPESSYALD